jgi:hypothetical protein
LKNESTLRVDQKTTLVFSAAEPQQPFLIELLNGAVHFFSRVHRSLRLVTPFVNGAVEGTEFVAQVSADRAVISLLEGRLRVSNPQGSLLMTQEPDGERLGQPAPGHGWRWCGQKMPCIGRFIIRPWLTSNLMISGCGDDWCAAARQSVGAWRRGDLLQAFQRR